VIRMEKPEEGIALLTFDRPEKLNALSSRMLDDLERHLRELGGDTTVRALILTGAGKKAFIAGADIGEYASQTDEQFVRYQQQSRALFSSIEAYPKTVIGAVNGYALGGGFEIALTCDLLVASENAEFGLPEGLLGLCPGGGGTQRLARAIGPFAASEVLLAARRLDAQRAHALGLVSQVVAPEKLLETAIALARDAMRVAPLASREMERLVREGLDASLESGLTLEQEALIRLYHTKDAGDGIRAFTEKRKPKFEGR
jgi:enoyl-CoA hydratase